MTSMVPIDWTSACVVPLYKGNSDSCECTCLLKVVRKVYGRRLIERIIRFYLQETGWLYRRKGFTVRQVCEKYLAKGK